MKKNLFLRLCLMMAIVLSLYSCIHDDLIVSDSTTHEYLSKSLWKEDETYIKNVMKVYLEHQDEIQKINGKPLWDYAMTMGRTDESFLIVPIANGKTIVSCLQVPREGEQIKFIFDGNPENIKFFQAYTTLEKRKPIKTEQLTPQTAKGVVQCVVSSVSMWYPKDEYGSNAGYWETQYITTCNEVSGGDMGGGICNGYYDSEGNCMPSYPPTYPYPGGGGGGGNPDTPTTATPCEKLKTQNDPTFQSKINTLKTNLTLKKETGYIENDNGNFTYKDNAGATENANTLSLPNPDYYKDIKGYMHTHPNDFEDSDGRPRTGFKIFSPADVMYFNELVRNAKENGLPLDNVYGVMVSGTGIYQIRFTGNANQIKTTYTNTGKQYNEMYLNYFIKHKDRSNELNFLKFMDEQMYVKGVSLVKMNNDGTFTTKTLNSDKSGVADSDCPQ